jgi:post-segregation antitoxin (ccd killing protein)
MMPSKTIDCASVVIGHENWARARLLKINVSKTCRAAIEEAIKAKVRADD